MGRVAGTVAAGLLLESVTVTGEAAARLSRTVPVLVVPPVTDVGLRVRAIARTASLAVRLVPPALAVTVTVVPELTPLVWMRNVTLRAPAGTVTLAGTRAAPLLLESATTIPPGGALALSVTVPVEASPSTT